MSPYAAYVLGILTILVILIPWWILSMRSTSVSNAYSKVFCNQIV